MLLSNEWKDYELIDTGNGEKLERWGEYVLRRPDPQVIWPLSDNSKAWDKADAHYHRSQSGGGSWELKRKLPERWTVNYDQLKFYVEPTGFKHTGLFPEQAVNWNWMIDKIRTSGEPVNVLNLFAYTGGATVAAAFAGAQVCHVDASKGMAGRAKENLN
jgi:23S rRNA (cytosine1962-C5)-methyltransferase